MATTWPVWRDRSEEVNLREVGPRLFVGAEGAPLRLPSGRGSTWSLVVDLYGRPFERAGDAHYRTATTLLHAPFLDGDRFPPGILAALLEAVPSARRRGPVLIHCQAGLSRSASAAYAILRLTDGLDHREALQRVHVVPEFPRPATLASARAFVQGFR